MKHEGAPESEEEVNMPQVAFNIGKHQAGLELRAAQGGRSGAPIEHRISMQAPRSLLIHIFITLESMD
jgi:hypothetical protein